MLTNLAALGIGLITAVATPATAFAHADCAPTQPSAHTSHRAPAPAYPPVTAHAPPRASAPTRIEAAYPASLRFADFNRDGGVTVNEARSYARSQFNRADLDRNGVLRGRELRSESGELVYGARGRDGVVTFAEYDRSVMGRFQSLDIDRNGYLSRNELGTNRTRLPSAPRANTVTYSWNWQL